MPIIIVVCLVWIDKQQTCITDWICTSQFRDKFIMNSTGLMLKCGFDVNNWVELRDVGHSPPKIWCKPSSYADSETKTCETHFY